jgi:hypothetical protein
MGWPRGLGGIQFTSWPPVDPELGGTPKPLPVQVAPNLADPPPSTEIFVGITVPEGGVLMNGVELQYTDGTTEWTIVVPQTVRFCTSGEPTDCQP